MFVIVWSYTVPAVQVAGFVRAYGPDGDWAQLFRSAPGYAGTELIECDDGRFLTIDRWHTRTAFDDFLLAHRADYDDLDDRLSALTTEEVRVGRGEGVTPLSQG